MFEFGEVIPSDYTYICKTPESQTLGDNLFTVKVRLNKDIYNSKPIYARPLDINNKKIPLNGEQVLLIKAPNQYSQNRELGASRSNWYYISTISLQSCISHNMLPGLAGNLKQEEIDNTKSGVTFDQTVSTSPLQPYEGDTITEGRHGNSIRLGSTSKQDEIRYNIQPTWNGDSVNDPIIILSNTLKRPAEDETNKKQFIVENIQTDDSSLYLTSKQKLSGFTLNTPLRNYTSESSFETSQFIGVADRVILKAKKDIIILDGKKSVVINTDELKLGHDKANEPMVHGIELATILKELIAIIQKPREGGGLSIAFKKPVLLELSQLSTRVDNIKSGKFFISK